MVAEVGHPPGLPCPCVSGWFPAILRDYPVTLPHGVGVDVPDRKIGVKGYSGRDAKSFANGGARVSFGR